jgi:hypothetical protein
LDKTVWGGPMTEYRAYLIGYHGRIQGYEPLSCANDGAAIVAAKRLMGSHGVEIWQDSRKVITLEVEQDHPVQRTV